MLFITNNTTKEITSWHVGEVFPAHKLGVVNTFQADGDELEYIVSALSTKKIKSIELRKVYIIEFLLGSEWTQSGDFDDSYDTFAEAQEVINNRAKNFTCVYRVRVKMIPN